MEKRSPFNQTYSNPSNNLCLFDEGNGLFDSFGTVKHKTTNDHLKMCHFDDDSSMEWSDSSVRNRINYFETQISDSTDDEIEMDTLNIALSRKHEFDFKFTHPIKSDPNMKVSDFYLVCTLGRGSFGRVLLSYQIKTSKFYALKVLKKSKLVLHRQLQNIINERNILNACNHPNILKLYKTFKDNSCLYFMIDACLNSDLYELLKDRKVFDERSARFYAANIFLALEYLHANNVIFRDLKLENVLVESNGYLKLIDFGFSKRLDRTGRTRTLCGTPDYISPEVIAKRPYGKSVDWWAFGIIIYELNTGGTPFKYEKGKEHLYTIVRRGVFEIPDRFSYALRDLCQKILSTDPNRRLGCQRRGSNDIKQHRWFSSIDWFLLYKQVLPAPFVPEEQTPSEFIDKSRGKKEEPIKIATFDKYSREFADF